MKLLIQRVQKASVTIEGKTIAQIDRGFVTLIGFEADDSEVTVRKGLEKVAKLRVFEDEAGKMNLNLLQVCGAHLLISQFTLCADHSEGNRPSFLKAAPPTFAKKLYDFALQYSQELGLTTLGGVFGADMCVHLVNDGPATFWLDIHGN